MELSIQDMGFIVEDLGINFGMGQLAGLDPDLLLTCKGSVGAAKVHQLIA